MESSFLTMDSFQELMNIGGWVLYGILLCSVVMLAVFLERLWVLRAGRVIPRHLAAEVTDLLQKGEAEVAVGYCEKEGSALGKILAQALKHRGHGLTVVQQAIDEEMQRQAHKLETGTGLLGIIVTLAPLLGFLGTVIGMVDLFSSVAAAGEVHNIGVIADGVYKALYTTVAGLIVAIPATLFHRYTLSLVDLRLLKLEEETALVVNFLRSLKEHPAAKP